MPQKRAQRARRVGYSLARLDAMREGRRAKIALGPQPDYRPVHRPDVAIEVILRNHELGATATIELCAPPNPRGRRERCDRYLLRVGGEDRGLSNKTALLALLGDLMPRVMGRRN